MNRFPILLLFACLTYVSFAQNNQSLPYKNASLPVDERVKDLLLRMTPEEKFWQLYMIPGDLDNATPDQYKNGIFGFQVSAAMMGASVLPSAAGLLAQWQGLEKVAVAAIAMAAVLWLLHESLLRRPESLSVSAMP